MISKKEADKEAYKELTSAILEKQKIESFDYDVRRAWTTMKNRGQILFKYETTNRRNADEQEVWDRFREENPIKHVGPQHYWKMPKLKPKQLLKMNVKLPKDDGEVKNYYMDRKKTDKTAYKPMKKHIF